MRKIPESGPKGKATYQTRQKQMLLVCMRKHGKALSAREWARLLKEEQQETAPGQSTVYRLLKSLTQEGRVRSLQEAGLQAQRFQLDEYHACQNSLHLKCLGCGGLMHLPEPQTDALSQHLLRASQFVVDPQTTTVFGWCVGCEPGERP